MMRCSYLVAVLLAGLLSSAGMLRAAPGPKPAGGPLDEHRPSADIWSLVEVSSDRDTQNLLAELDVDVEGGSATKLHVLIRADQLYLLDVLRIPYSVLHSDHAGQQPETLGERGLGYHNADGVLFSLEALAEQYPEVVRYVDLGRSWEGRRIGGLLLSDQPHLREFDEPSLRLLGGHHGDEYSSVEVTLDIAWTLAERYKAGDSEAQNLLDNNELWIAPLINPDGHVEFTRRNSRNVDLNRNYSYLWSSTGAGGDAPFSEVETAAIRGLSVARSFHHSLSLHSGATNLGWVWNSLTLPTPEEPWMEARCNDYLGATEDPDFWITNGADWYISFGDTNDWSYGNRGGHDYTLEVSLEKTPPEEDLPGVLAFHTGPSISFLAAGGAEGILFRVIDSEGRPVEAEIGGADLTWRGYSDPETGIFARPLAEGGYNLSIEALGYPDTQAEFDSSIPPQLTEVVLTIHPGTVPTRVEGAEISEAQSGNLAICSPRIEETAGEVEVLFSREGPLPADGLHAETEVGSPCISVEFSPRDLISEAWRREGEWSVVVMAEGGESLALLPMGVLIAAADPGFSIHEISLEEGASKGQVDLLLEGTELPRGALIRAIGPEGSRALPVDRPVDLGDDSYRVSFDTENWQEGPWSLRIFGGGHWLALSGVLLLEDGVLTAQDLSDPEEPPEPPDPEAEEEDTPLPGVLGGGGCTCGELGNVPPPLRVSGLALALLVGYSRRRRRTCP
jgi:hypothetical protein